MTRDEKIVSLKDKGESFRKIGQLFGISYQRALQIYAKKYPNNYSKKTANIQDKKNISEIKIWNSEKRKSLGLPDGFINLPNGDGRNYVREIVRMRDNHMCQKYGKKWVVGTRRLDVHHTDPEMEGKSKIKGIAQLDKQNFDKMITYCHKCHFSEHSVREKMSGKRKVKFNKFINS